MRRNILTAALAAALTLTLTACSGGKVDIPGSQSGDGDFQKAMHQSTASRIGEVCETDSGLYVTYNARLYYVDKATGRATHVCGKPDCDHEGDDCNSYVNSTSIWYADGKLWFTNGDYVPEGGGYTNYGWRVYSMSLNGDGRKAEQALEFTPGGDIMESSKTPICHRGRVYFAFRGALYSAPLGGDIDDAEHIWGEPVPEDDGSNGMHLMDSSVPTYSLWADGDHVYFMVNVLQEDGTMKDTLFDYDLTDKSVKQVWQVPDGSEVGEWDRTGVSVDQWYVIGGYIYYFLPGNGFWRGDTATGRNQRLVDTTDKTSLGTAIFSDDYMCLIDDEPDPSMAGAVLVIGSVDTLGGDTIYLYSLDGKLVKELSLKSLYDELETLENCKLVCCTGGQIYFFADAGHKVDRGPGIGVTGETDQRLYSIDIDTGEMKELYAWH